MKHIHIEGMLPVNTRRVWIIACFFVGLPLSAAWGEPKTSEAGAGMTTLSVPPLQARIDPQTGRVLSVKDGRRDQVVVETVTDRYVIKNETNSHEADETSDRVIEHLQSVDGASATFVCRNVSLPGLQIEKHYRIDEQTNALIKEVRFRNDSQRGFFIKYYTRANASDSLLKDGFYYRPRKFGRFLVAADGVSKPVSLGRDQVEIHRIMFAAPERKLGVVHHRYRVDGRVTLFQTSNNFERHAAFLPDGWRFSICAFHLKEGEARSAETRLEVFDGDALGFLIRYRHRPQIEKEIYDLDVPAWVRQTDVVKKGQAVDIDGELTHQPWYDFYREEDLGSILLLHYPLHWGDVPSTGVYKSRVRRGGTLSRLDLDKARRKTRRQHQRLHQTRLGVYTMIRQISSESRTFQQHPDFVVYRRDGTPDYEPRRGKPRLERNDGAPVYLNELGAPGAAEYWAARYGRFAGNLEFDFVYIDGAPTGISRLNWWLNRVTQGYQWIDAFRGIRQGIREANPQGALFLNSNKWPVADIHYWERGSWHRQPKKDWRIIPISLSLAKINMDPEAALVPMRWAMWKGRNPRRLDLHEPAYPNYLLAFGLVPYLDNLTLGVVKKRLPIIRAAKELRGSEMVDADVSPAWWKHFEPIGVEAYTLRRGRFGLVPVMSRQREDAAAELSFDTGPLGLSPDYPVYLWVNSFITPRHETLTIEESRKHTEPSDAYPRAFKTRVLSGPEAFAERVSVDLKLPGAGQRFEMEEPGPLQLVVASSVPAWVYEAEGDRYQSALPEQDGVQVTPASGRDDELRFRVWTDKQDVKIFVPETLLPFPVEPAVQIEGEAVAAEPATWDNEQGLLVPAPTGLHVVTLTRKE